MPSKVISLLIVLAGFAASCKSEPVEPAPLSGGETLAYTIDGPRFVLTLEKKGDGFLIRSDNSSHHPQEVAANLRAGRKPVTAGELGMIWLEPSKRVIGAQVPLGNVISEEKRNLHDCFKVSERNGHVERWFDRNTGFLVEKRVNPSGPTTQLVATTVPGL